jgi:transposase-like protein
VLTWVIKENKALMITRTALENAISQLSLYQVDKIQNIVMEYHLLNYELESVWTERRPKCGAVEHSHIKKDFSRRKQRFQCKCCQKGFTYDSQYITYYSHKPLDAWSTALEATLRLDSLSKRYTTRSLNETPSCVVFTDSIWDYFICKLIKSRKNRTLYSLNHFRDDKVRAENGFHILFEVKFFHMLSAIHHFHLLLKCFPAISNKNLKT